ncbi:MAG: 7-carboxy-7-deazaguanine synthase QueE [Gammaproteobacteria bacterium]
MSSVRITEIFCSIQGETTTAGELTVFVRLTGCPLRCQYCDTAYAFTGGKKMAINDIVATVVDYGISHVTVTGGEPLAQVQCFELLRRLCDEGLQVSVETSGAISIEKVDPRVRTILDIKTPGSCEDKKDLPTNIDHLKPGDEIKFVICDRKDYDYALDKVIQNDLAKHYQILFSPSFGQVEPQELAQWMMNDKVDARLQLQLHKYLWGDEPGR